MAVVTQEQMDWRLERSGLKKRNPSHIPITTEGLLEHFSIAGEKLEKCKPYVKAFVSTTEKNVGMLLPLDCGCWECCKCGPKKKVDWFLRLVPLIDDNNISYMEVMDADATETKAWKAFKKRISRKKGRYVRFKTSEEKAKVLVDIKSGGIPLSKDARLTTLYRLITKTAFIRKPITMSGRWKEKEKYFKEPNDNWKPLDTCAFPIDECEKILRDNGALVTHKLVRGNKVLEYKNALIFMVLDDPNTKINAFTLMCYRLGIWTRMKGEVRARGRPGYRKKLSVFAA